MSHTLTYAFIYYHTRAPARGVEDGGRRAKEISKKKKKKKKTTCPYSEDISKGGRRAKEISKRKSPYSCTGFTSISTTYLSTTIHKISMSFQLHGQISVCFK